MFAHNETLVVTIDILHLAGLISCAESDSKSLAIASRALRDSSEEILESGFHSSIACEKSFRD
jgi:hypothetical protein